MDAKALVLDKLVQRQAHLFELQRRLHAPRSATHPPFITISREFGCPGVRLGLALLESLNTAKLDAEQWSIYDRRVFDFIQGDPALNRRFFEEHMERRAHEFEEYLHATFAQAPSDLALFQRWSAVMRELARAGQAVFVGRASHMVTRDLPGGLHLRVVAPFEWRVIRHMEDSGLPENEARTITRLKDRERQDYLHRYFGGGAEEAGAFHLVFNAARLGVEDMVKLATCQLERMN